LVLVRLFSTPDLAPSTASTMPQRRRPAWDGDLKDGDLYRLPREEQQRRKELTISKNNILGRTPTKSPRIPRTPLVVTPRAKAFSFSKAQTGRSPYADQSSTKTQQSDELISTDRHEQTPQRNQAEKTPPRQVDEETAPQTLSKLSFEEEIKRFESGAAAGSAFKDAEEKKFAYQVLCKNSSDEAVEVLREVRGVLAGTPSNLSSVTSQNQEASPTGFEQRLAFEQDPEGCIAPQDGSLIGQLLKMVVELASRITAVESEARLEREQREALQERVQQQTEETTALRAEVCHLQRALQAAAVTIHGAPCQRALQPGGASARATASGAASGGTTEAIATRATTRTVSSDWHKPQTATSTQQTTTVTAATTTPAEMPPPPPPPPSLPAPAGVPMPSLREQFGQRVLVAPSTAIPLTMPSEMPTRTLDDTCGEYGQNEYGQNRLEFGAEYGGGYAEYGGGYAEYGRETTRKHHQQQQQQQQRQQQYNGFGIHQQPQQQEDEGAGEQGGQESGTEDEQHTSTQDERCGEHHTSIDDLEQHLGHQHQQLEYEFQHQLEHGRQHQHQPLWAQQLKQQLDQRPAQQHSMEHEYEQEKRVVGMSPAVSTPSPQQLQFQLRRQQAELEELMRA
jgi:hypothetical protein